MATAVPAVVDVPQQVADWLVTYGVLRHGQSVMTAKGEQVRQVTGAEWSTVQNGFSVGKVLSDHFAKHGHAGVVPTLLEGTTLQVGPSVLVHMHVLGLFCPALPCVVFLTAPTHNPGSAEQLERVDAVPGQARPYSDGRREDADRGWRHGGVGWPTV